MSAIPVSTYNINMFSFLYLKNFNQQSICFNKANLNGKLHKCKSIQNLDQDT